MARKKWTPETDTTPELVLAREKRKWQIALRRYVIDKNPSVRYAPYFGLDIKSMRQWFELQFHDRHSWDNFGSAWQFEHSIPVSFFDFQNNNDLKLCWNFLNLRVGSLIPGQSMHQGYSLFQARNTFRKIYEATKHSIALQLLEKIEQIDLSQQIHPQEQIDFLTSRKNELESLRTYGEFEFNLLNQGLTIKEVNEELEQLKKIRF